SRLLSISEASITKVVGAFCFPTDFTDAHRFFSRFILLPFLPLNLPFTLLLFYLFTFITLAI
ncbi:hypothetical protein, partial [Segatella copri]|uniref:hypothetical protein n=1 Tax=Segatella copri TaxID=165179 RepID=UPI001D17A4AA